MSAIADKVTKAVLQFSHALEAAGLKPPVSVSLDPDSYRAVASVISASKNMVLASDTNEPVLAIAGVEIKEEKRRIS